MVVGLPSGEAAQCQSMFHCVSMNMVWQSGRSHRGRWARCGGEPADGMLREGQGEPAIADSGALGPGRCVCQSPEASEVPLVVLEGRKGQDPWWDQ